MIDQEKARSNLNEQLARILNKRKKDSTTTITNSSDSSAAAEVTHELQKEQNMEIEKPWGFGLLGLKKSL